MKIIYKINNGMIYEIPKYWNVKLLNNMINIYIYNNIIVCGFLVNNNTYIGYNNNDIYTIYYYD